jgi:hypothetical protein
VLVFFADALRMVFAFCLGLALARCDTLPEIALLKVGLATAANHSSAFAGPTKVLVRALPSALHFIFLALFTAMATLLKDLRPLLTLALVVVFVTMLAGLLLVPLSPNFIALARPR